MKKYTVAKNRFQLYPELQINELEKGLDKFMVIETTLRVKGENGKYYLRDFRYSCEFLECDHEDYAFQKNSIFERLITDVYLTIICGTLNSDIADDNGDNLFYEDINQQPEYDRIIGLEP